MYRCVIRDEKNLNRFEELIKVFLMPGEYEISDGSDGGTDGAHIYDPDDPDAIKRLIYRDLEEITGKSPEWGILTGIRPVKLAGEIYERTGSADKAREILENEYLLSGKKAGLVTEILSYQREKAGLPRPGTMSVYAGIPFCPTRCLYCSFTSNQVPDKEISRYLEALLKETEYAAGRTKAFGIDTESVYIGGGTPTTLDEDQLEELLRAMSEGFCGAATSEFTVEAGRADTITEGKLEVMKGYGVGRISINPQTMNAHTLEVIGRRHTPEDAERAFDMAERAGIDVVNADLIAGLPGEDTSDLMYSLEKVLVHMPENITLHTLAVKRASRLKDADEFYNYRNEDNVRSMLSAAEALLRSRGYRPYYLYRQKHTSGDTENIGYCRDDRISVYNIRIMEEAQSILALGAGGISKTYYASENRLERVANVSNYEIYIDRLEEMEKRKEEGFFTEELWRK